MDKYVLNNEADHHAAIRKVAALMKKGEKKHTEKKAEKIKALHAAIETYKNGIYTISAPTTLEETIELKMYERKLKQKDLAKLLGIGEAKLSQIMGKKRKPDVAFLKALHEKLGIDGNIIFTHI